MNPLSGGKVPVAVAGIVRPTGIDGATGFEMHFDARFGGVEKGNVPPVADAEIGIEPGIDMAQQVSVESRGHAKFIVIGRVQQRVILDQVDTDQRGLLKRPSDLSIAAETGRLRLD